MSLSLLFTLTLAPFLTAWLLAEGVRQVDYAKRLRKQLRQSGVNQ